MSTRKTRTAFDHFRRVALTALLAVATMQWAHASPQPMTDKDFVQEAFSNAQVEIELSRVALEKGANARTKKLAKSIIKDNSAANAQLRTLATTRKLDLPAQLDKEQQERIDQLKKSDQKTFDAAYRQQLEQMHGAAIALFDKVAKNPRADAELRVFASKRLPLYKKQQEMLEKIGDSAKVAAR